MMEHPTSSVESPWILRIFLDLNLTSNPPKDNNQYTNLLAFTHIKKEKALGLLDGDVTD